MPRVVACPDKLRGTLTAAGAAAAVADAAWEHGWTCTESPVSDGGEGFLEAFGGSRRTSRVLDPLGRPVDAGWRLLDGGRTAVVEAALASGLALVGGPQGNKPLEASTAGTGQVIAAAVAAGARRVLVGVGGSATTDGGLGAYEALGRGARSAGIELVVACDVTTRFLEAASRFGPQKGATPKQVELLARRLERVAQVYEAERRVDVRPLEGSGAAGGLAGGLAALGATLTPGFDVIADALDLVGRLEGADLVVTGEGFLDEESFHGKAVGGVCHLAALAGVPVLVVVGDHVEDLVELGVPADVEVVSLVDRFGEERAWADTAAALREVVGARLAR